MPSAAEISLPIITTGKRGWRHLEVATPSLSSSEHRSAALVLARHTPLISRPHRHLTSAPCPSRPRPSLAASPAASLIPWVSARRASVGDGRPSQM
jgi:hypothetical protein